METGADVLARSYHKTAARFLRFHYMQNDENSILFRFHFCGELAREAKHIAKSLKLHGMDYQDAVVSTWFSYAGPSEILMPSVDTKIKLLNEYFDQAAYPQDHRAVVENAVTMVTERKAAATTVEQVVSDAVYSQFGSAHLLENLVLLKDEVNRIFSMNKTELFYLQYYEALAVGITYYTSYAHQHYAARCEKNVRAIGKRIRRLVVVRKAAETPSVKINPLESISTRETEDLFKLALRNYNHLISVADSKASLLIHVNAIIISVMLAFVVRQLGQFSFLQAPAILLLLVSLVTIFLSILASRPQPNNGIEKSRFRQSQCFFFGSFDLIDPGFRHVSWTEYLQQTTSLFTSSRETVYLELYKESYDVRKVLSKKFNFLSMAYWVFIIGLLLSVTAFAAAIRFR